MIFFDEFIKIEYNKYIKNRKEDFFMRKRFEKIIAGTTGMAIISNDTAFVSLEMGEDRFTLLQQPEFFVNSKHKYFELTKKMYYPREGSNIKKYQRAIAFIVLQMITMHIIFSVNALRESNDLRFGMWWLFYGISILCNMFFINKIKIRYLAIEESIARKRCALNKAINAYYKLGRIPSLDEVRKANCIPTTMKRKAEPLEIVSISATLYGATVVMLSISSNVFSFIIIGIIILLIIKFRIYNLMEISQMAKPLDYELNEARFLISYFNKYAS